MLLTGTVAYIILIIIELGSIKMLKMFILKLIRLGVGNRGDTDNDNLDAIDDDVQAEKIRIDQMTDVELQSEAVVLKNVSKHYGQFTAVKNVSFSINR